MRSRKSRARQPAERSAAVSETEQSTEQSTEDAAEQSAETTPAAEVAATSADAGAASEAVGAAGPQADEDPVAYWRSAVLADAESVTARRRLALALLERGEELQAVEQLEAARNIAPEDLSLIVELAQVQTALRRFDAAERELRRTLRFESGYADVHVALGVISFRRGLYAQCEQEMKRALELDPESGTAYFYRGEALNQLSRVDEALDMLQRAVALQPSNARAYYVMGILYDRKGRSQEAGSMYRQAREAGGA